MARWSWVPGLPTLGPRFDLWAIDLSEEQRPLDNADLLVCVADDGDSGVYLAANRVGRPVSLADARLCRRDHDKKHTQIGGRRLLIKHWRAVVDGAPDCREPPAALQGPLAPCAFGPAARNDLAAWMAGDETARHSGCGADIDDETTDMRTIDCQQCGATTDPAHVDCPECGGALRG